MFVRFCKMNKLNYTPNQDDYFYTRKPTNAWKNDFK